jgi:hypothetical protein
MILRASIHSYKTGDCRRLAEHIRDAAVAMGLESSINKSRLSASHYVYVAANEESDDRLKIRCSDHDDKHASSDWYCWAGECPSKIIARIADHFGVAVPAGYRAEDYGARSAAAKKAATTRRATAQATEAEMIAAVVKAMTGAKSIGAVAAGRAIDQVYPSIPRAQRQRLAGEISRRLERDRAIAAAGDDPVKLAPLAVRYPEAKAILRSLVSEEQFKSLRPAGCPRSYWSA